jgi:CRP/FNR family transcriptional regulator
MKCDVDPCNCLICKDKCPFFHRLNPSELEKLNSAKRAVKYSKGEVILKKDTYNPYILLLSSGFVKVIVEAEFEKKFIMEILEPHNFVPGNIFGDGINRSTVVALSEVVICFIATNVFQELLESNGRFSTDIMKYMNLHGGLRFSRLKSITLKQTRGKLADVILYVDGLKNGKSIFRSLSRKDLADLANISMENAIRTLKEFELEGVIRTQKKEIEIVDVDVLSRISQKG